MCTCTQCTCKKKVFGSPVVGIWYCECGYRIFPNSLKEQRNGFTWKIQENSEWSIACCPVCNKQLKYDEEG